MQAKDRIKVIRHTVVINASVNMLLALLKVVIGFFGHSQALIADGVHSFTDLITDSLVFFAAKAGAQKADKDHPYGHQRIETLASIVIAVVLASVAIGIAYETIDRILTKATAETPAYAVLVIAVIAIFANEFLFYFNRNRGNKIDSNLLHANAWHNRSDTLVSVTVLISVIGSLLGAHYLDAIGALFIALLILKMAIKMIWNSVKELIDTGVEESLIEKISEHILQIDGVSAVHQLRTRHHGKTIFLDAHIEVSPDISVSEGHYISEQVGFQLSQAFPKIIDTTVHIDPENDEIPKGRHLPDRSHIEKSLKDSWQSISSASTINKLTLHYLNEKISVDVYLPLSSLEKSDKKTLQHRYQQAVQHIKFIDKVTLYFQ